MCEMLAIASPTPVSIDDVLEWSLLLDEFGVAGFSWGMVWTDGETLHRYRCVDGIRRDPLGLKALRNQHLSITRGYVHLRRPTYMTTISHINAQPYLSPDGEWAFGHNGFLKNHRQYRDQYTGRLEGTSDSEVGFWYWLDQLSEHRDVARSLEKTHQALDGRANFMSLGKNGDLGVYAGNDENPVYTFRIGSVHLAATSLHSPDHFLFDAIFPNASDIQPVPLGTAILMP